MRNQGAAAVAGQMEKILREGAQRLNEARIIILGDKGSGKTCLARRLVDPKAPMTTDEESTPGVDTTLWKLEKENINVRIWDFAGHTVTHAVHQFFLSERCLYIIVYDGRSEMRNQLDYWLDHMKNFGGDSQAIILINKRDQHSVEIPLNTLKEKYPIAGDYTFSIQDDEKKLESFRKVIANHIVNNPSWENQVIPESYYQVKEDLEKLFTECEDDDGKEHITIAEFEKIAKQHGVEKTEELLKDLHFLGISLWYKNMAEYNTLILNPEWISHGVYKIINWVNEDKKYSVSLNDFSVIFKEVSCRYPTEKYNFLFQLMKHYE
jgi:small GTP-binding protein